MRNTTPNRDIAEAPPSFGLARLSTAKATVGLHPNTVKNYARAKRLRLYRLGRTTWFDPRELEALIRR